MGSEPKWTPPAATISRCVEAYDNADPNGDASDEGMRAAISASGLPALMAAVVPIVERAAKLHQIGVSTEFIQALAAVYKLAKEG